MTLSSRCARALRAHVDHLAVSCFPRDHAHPEGMRQAAAYIRAQLEAVGVQCALQHFDVDGRTHMNVLGRVGPEDGPRVVVGAHYDTCGPQPGADDNASGIAGLIEVARQLAASAPRTRVDLAAYALEEPPHFGTAHMGSVHHARALRAEGAQVRAMVALEMIGFFTDAPGSQRYPLPAMNMVCPTTGNFIGLVGRMQDAPLVRRAQAAMERGARGLPVVALPLPAWVTGVTWSDHASFWAEGFPALMVTDTSLFRNPHLHTAGDAPDTLDVARMEQVVHGVVSLVRTLAA